MQRLGQRAALQAMVLVTTLKVVVRKILVKVPLNLKNGPKNGQFFALLSVLPRPAFPTTRTPLRPLGCPPHAPFPPHATKSKG